LDPLTSHFAVLDFDARLFFLDELRGGGSWRRWVADGRITTTYARSGRDWAMDYCMTGLRWGDLDRVRVDVGRRAQQRAG